MNNTNQDLLREQYVSRVNRVVDYIEANLDANLSLRTVAEVADFSPYYFHRIFHAMVGETLNHFIQRLRIEKAATQLIANPKTSITEIALGCGFSGSAAFARAFKMTFGMSASEWRCGGYQQHRNICKANSNNNHIYGNIEQAHQSFLLYTDTSTRNLVWRTKVEDTNLIHVEVKDMPAIHVAYVRHTGPYQGDTGLFQRLFEQLMTWAGPRDLLRSETQMLCAYHDDPDITNADRLRTSVCITVPEGTPTDGEIGEMTIPGGRFAIARFELLPHEYQQAWDTLFGGWLPQSGYQPDDGLCYELYQGSPEQHPEGKHIVDICIPVKPL
ncbi:MAG: GyrI-like domain-containing protein [Chloroflexota bacterium]|nr:GyrI-like domain-containing protein [Chloroflexota bacterium]